MERNPLVVSEGHHCAALVLVKVIAPMALAGLQPIPPVKLANDGDVDDAMETTFSETLISTHLQNKTRQSPHRLSWRRLTIFLMRG